MPNPVLADTNTAYDPNNDIRERVLSCNACALRANCTSPVPGHGNPNAYIMLVGEAPGMNEDRIGRCFMGKAGNELNRYLDGIGLNRDLLYITNSIKCRPPENAEPKPEESAACLKHLQAEMARIRPKIIGALGGYATRAFLGDEFPLDRHHGIPEWCLFNLGNGELHHCLVVPLYHPALGLHSSSMMNRIEGDFHALKQVAEGKLRPEADPILKPDYRIVMDSDLKWLQDYFEFVPSELEIERRQCIHVDTETDTDRNAWSIQFSKQEGEGYMIIVADHDSQKALTAFKSYVERQDVCTVFHSAKFDWLVLQKLGIDCAHIADTMQAAYLLNTEPQGLKDLAYRHDRMLMKKFTEMTRPATVKRFREYFERIAALEWPMPPEVREWCPDPKLEFKHIESWLKCTVRHKDAQLCPECEGASLTTKGTWECNTCGNTGFARLVRKRNSEKFIVPGTENGFWKIKNPQPIERKVIRLINDMETNPKTNPIERWGNYDKSSRDMVAEVLGPLKPCDLRDILLDDAVYYSCRDADATCRTANKLYPRIISAGLLPTHDADLAIVPILTDMERAGVKVDMAELADLQKDYEGKQLVLENDIEGFCGKRINLRSPQQLGNYLYGELKIKPTKMTKNDTASTDEEALSDIKSRHPSIPKIMEWRKLEKLREFTVSIQDAADSQHRVHSEFLLSRTATGRLASKNINLQNIPKHGEHAKKIRKVFIPQPGCVLLSGDYAQIEMRMAAHVAQDDKMMEVFLKGIDLHSATAANIFGIPLKDVDKEKHRQPAKTVGFGVLYQMGPEALMDQLIASGCTGWSLKACERLIADWFGVYDDIDRYFKHIVAEARRNKFVVDMFGRHYHIPDIKSSDKRIQEEGRRNACSYTIQGAAAGLMKRGMAQMIPVYRSYRESGFVCNPLMQIHDDLLWEVSEEIAFEFGEVFKAVMENCVPMSIPIDVDLNMGYKWGEMFGM